MDINNIMNKIEDFHKKKLLENSISKANKAYNGYSRSEKHLKLIAKVVSPPNERSILTNLPSCFQPEKNSITKRLNISSFHKLSDTKSYSPAKPEENLDRAKIRPNPGANSRLNLKTNEKVLKIRHFSGEVNSNFERKIIDKMIQIEKTEGKDLSSNKTKQYFDLFDDISELLPGIKVVIKNFRDHFQKLFFLSQSQTNEIEQLTKKLKEKFSESFDITQTISNFDESESNFIQKLISENATHQDSIISLQKELNSYKTKEKQYKNLILHLKANSENFEVLFQDYFSKIKKTRTRVPKLSLKTSDSSKENFTDESSLTVPGFHEEFMSKISEFSESWRKQAEDQKRF